MRSTKIVYRDSDGTRGYCLVGTSPRKAMLSFRSNSLYAGAKVDAVLTVMPGKRYGVKIVRRHPELVD